MSLTSDERKSVVEFRIEKARRALEQAQGVVELQYWETIANRLYYAAYNAVFAAIIIPAAWFISSSFFYALNRRLR